MHDKITKKPKKELQEKILIGDSDFSFNQKDPYQVILYNSYYEHEENLNWNDVEVLIEWLQKIRPMMKKKVVIDGKSYSQEEVKELFEKLKEYLDESADSLSF